MSIDLPAPLSRYFLLANGEPGTRVEQCFAAAATVRDERQQHQGHTAIAAWVAQTRAAYQHHVVPLQLHVQDGRHIVSAQVSGTFPGSPVALTHAFTLQGDGIVALDIH